MSGVAAGGGDGGAVAGAAMAAPVGTATGSATTSGTSGNASAAANAAGAAAPAMVSGQVDWTSTLNDDLKGFVQNKGFKDPAAVLDSYRNLEKVMGTPKERLLSLPARDDDAEGWKQIHARLGRPEKSDDYKTEGAAFSDPETAKWAQRAFHDLNLSKKQGEGLAAKWSELVANQDRAFQEQTQAQVAEQEKLLQRDWGAAYEKNMHMAAQAMEKFGLPVEVCARIGAALTPADRTTMVRAFAKVAEGLGEDGFIAGGSKGGFNGILSPEAARNRIAQLRGDDAFIQRYVDGELSAKEEMERLHKFAAGG